MYNTYIYIYVQMIYLSLHGIKIGENPNSTQERSLLSVDSNSHKARRSPTSCLQRELSPDQVLPMEAQFL